MQTASGQRASNYGKRPVHVVVHTLWQAAWEPARTARCKGWLTVLCLKGSLLNRLHPAFLTPPLQLLLAGRQSGLPAPATNTSTSSAGVLRESVAELDSLVPGGA